MGQSKPPSSPSTTEHSASCRRPNRRRRRTRGSTRAGSPSCKRKAWHCHRSQQETPVSYSTRPTIRISRGVATRGKHWSPSGKEGWQLVKRESRIEDGSCLSDRVFRERFGSAQHRIARLDIWLWKEGGYIAFDSIL